MVGSGFQPLRAEQLPAALELLTDAALPTDDVDETLVEGFIGWSDEEGKLTAMGGLERYGEHALLRSVVVAPAARGGGLAQALVTKLEADARARGIRRLFLLTESAEGFFLKLGFGTCPRGEAPVSIQRSPQFADLCPDSAAFLCKEI
ncbi:MAG: arsenic resistance N-acetyltransferase ArsN2 [Pseudomonadota bacterium]